MFAPIWKGYSRKRIMWAMWLMAYIFPTWCATEWEKLFKDNFDEELYSWQSNQKSGSCLRHSGRRNMEYPPETKNQLIDYIKRKCSKDWLRSQIDPSLTISIFEKFNPNALLIGFGRRFATYKRAHLLFTDIDRLAKIVNNPKYPVQFIFTGKAHPVTVPARD